MFICMNNKLRLVSFCPACESKCEAMNVKKIGEEGKIEYVYVHCKKCRHSVLVAVKVHKVGANSIGFLTDLSFEDAIKLRKNQAVSINDVIDLHMSVENGTFEFALDKVRTNSA